jgi:ferredoxin
MCEAAAPDFCEVQDDGSLSLLNSEAGENRRSELEEAVEGCPTTALSLSDD